MTASLTRPMICLWGKYLTCCCLRTCMRFMASLSWSSWCAELRASRRMSVSFISFSLSSLRSCITVSASLSRHSDNLHTQTQLSEVTLFVKGKVWYYFPACSIWQMRCTYSELECVFLSMWLEAPVPLWGSLGEAGSDESVISSMSE